MHDSWTWCVVMPRFASRVILGLQAYQQESHCSPLPPLSSRPWPINSLLLPSMPGVAIPRDLIAYTR